MNKIIMAVVVLMVFASCTGREQSTEFWVTVINRASRTAGKIEIIFNGHSHTVGALDPAKEDKGRNYLFAEDYPTEVVVKVALADEEGRFTDKSKVTRLEIQLPSKLDASYRGDLKFVIVDGPEVKVMKPDQQSDERSPK